jgi:rod shape-determining protein MreC
VVQLLMRARVSALVQDGRAQGIVSWIKGNRFRLGLVEASSVVQRGDRVISSGLGGRYPKGIPIGVLVEVRSLERDPLFQEVILESNVDFLELEEVFVIRPEN